MVSAFIGGMARAANTMIDEKRQYIRDITQQRRDELRQAGYQRLAEARQMRQGLQQAADVLASAGMSQENIVALLEDNPTMFAQVADSVRQMALNGEPPENINSLVRFAGNARPSGTSLAEAITNAAPGIIRANQGVRDPSQRERNTLASLFGLDTESALQRDVYGQEIVEGFTGEDIATSMTAEALTPARPGNIQIDYSVLRSPDSGMGLSTLAPIVDNIAATYTRMAESAIREIQAEFALPEDEIAARAAENGMGPQEYLAALVDEQSRYESVLSQPSAAARIEMAIEAGLDPQSLVRVVERVPNLFDPLLGFNAGFGERFSEILSGTVTEPQTEMEDVTPEEEEGPVAPLPSGAPISEQPLEERTEAVGALVDIINESEIATYLEFTSKAQTPRAESLQSVATYNPNTDQYIPTEEFLDWSYQDRSRIEALRIKPDVVIDTYLYDTGKISEEDLNDTVVSSILSDLLQTVNDGEMPSDSSFEQWRDSEAEVDPQMVVDEVAYDRVTRLTGYANRNIDDFLAWIREDPERADRFAANPFMIMAEFEALQ